MERKYASATFGSDSGLGAETTKYEGPQILIGITI